MKMPDMNESGIIESGSNENGHWTKFSDGTLICRRNGIDAPANTQSIDISTPHAFIDNTYTVIAVNAYANSANVIWNSGGLNGNTIRLYPRKSDGAFINKNERCNYVAMRLLEITKERWKVRWKKKT